MYLISLETANPQNQYTQEDCLRIFRASGAARRLKERSVSLMEKVLNRDNGIGTRGFCFPRIESIFDAGPEELNHVFEAEAPRLGTEALKKALEAAHLKPEELDGLVVCTCTGYLCPGLSSHIAEQAGLRKDCDLVDIVGMGCGASIPALRSTAGTLAAHPDNRIAVLAVEICSAAFYLDDDPGVLISACLFGDGAAASIWTGRRSSGATLRTSGFRSLHLPEKRGLLRFENAGGALRNRLSKRVPAEAAAAVHQLFGSALPADADPEGVRILAHPGGRDVLDELEAVFPGRHFPESREILLHHGNLSSPSILYVLDHYRRTVRDPADHLWLASFGAGFTAHGVFLHAE